MLCPSALDSGYGHVAATSWLIKILFPPLEMARLLGIHKFEWKNDSLVQAKEKCTIGLETKNQWYGTIHVTDEI